MCVYVGFREKESERVSERESVFERKRVRE